jgi:hypothetical protein
MAENDSKSTFFSEAMLSSSQQQNRQAGRLAVWLTSRMAEMAATGTPAVTWFYIHGFLKKIVYLRCTPKTE